jgi:hypothetical protein
MFNPFAAFAVVLVIAAAAFYATGKRRLGCWLQVLFPAILYGWVLGDRYIATEAKALCLSVLGLSLLAALRPRWPWLFWAAWLLNAFVCYILLYAIFFWKVFS